MTSTIKEIEMYVIIDSDTKQPLLSGEVSNSTYHKPKYFIYSDLRKAKLGIGVINNNRAWKQLSPAMLYRAEIKLIEEQK